MRIKYFMITLGVSAVVVTGCSSVTTPVSDPINTEISDSNTKEEELGDKAIGNQEEGKEEVDNNAPVESDYMDEFNILLNDAATTPKELFEFMNKNISSLSKEDITTALVKTEAMQKTYLSVLENQFFAENTQNEIQNSSFDMNNLDSITDETIKELLTLTKAAGYYVETAEGSYFPVIDYSIYKDYTLNAADDMKEYFEIMTIESNVRFAKDAALQISFEEVLNRGLRAEGFLNTYKDSIKYMDVLKLYNLYESIALNGLNNTPLFDYDSNAIDTNAKESYQKFVEANKDSGLATIIKDFLAIIDENKGRLSQAVEDFRDGIEEASNQKLQKLNPYYVAGIDNPAEFEEMFQLLQTYVKNNEKEKVASYIAYPISVTINNEKTTITTEDEFISNYDQIFNESVKTAFLNQNMKDLFVNYKGVMVGEGQLWFSIIEGTTHKYSIYGINN